MVFALYFVIFDRAVAQWQASMGAAVDKGERVAGSTKCDWQVANFCFM
jgi:hypothetical protein